MWRFPLFTKFIEDLVDNEFVDQVIIIDNDNTKTPKLIDNKKIELIDFGFNLIVNPSWNLAVRYSRNEDICIVNDDIIYDLRVFKHLSKIEPNQFGSAGMVCGDKFLGPFTKTGIIEISLLKDIYVGFGHFMYVKKSQYINIPHELKFGYGDDWMIFSNISRKLLVYIIDECLFMTEGSMTMREVQGKESIFKYETEKFLYYRSLLDENNDEKSFSLQNKLAEDTKIYLDIVSDMLNYNYSVTTLTYCDNDITKMFLANFNKVRTYTKTFDPNLQEMFYVMRHIKDVQYECVFQFDTEIEASDILFVNAPINNLSDYLSKAEKFVIIRKEYENQINDDWVKCMISHENIIYKRLAV